MPRDLRPTLAVPLVVASMAGLLACPQLLSDDFGAVLEAGGDTCARRQTCAFDAEGSASASGSPAGSAGTPSGAGGSAPSAGGFGAGGAGTGGSADTPPEAGSGGASASGAGPDASAPAPDSDTIPACWTIALEDDTHVASDNCLGINGWNAVETDPLAPATSLGTSYSDGEVCFTGSIANSGWGAVYNLTLDDTDPWNAVAAGVGGFELQATGASLPPQMQLKYTDDSAGDFCSVITPAASVEVPFSNAHPGCSTSSSSVTDAIDLTYIRLVFPPAASAYAVDFCLGIRAIP